jgi:leader peptidase (prepilin peptidase)/N-methyltransferase
MAWGWHLPGALLAVAALGWLSILDWRTHTLPRRILYLTAALGLPWLLLSSVLTGHYRSLLTMVGGATLALIGFGGIRILTRGNFGAGDVRLAVLLGAYLGWMDLIYAPVGLLAGLSLAGMAGGLGWLTGRLSLTSEIPLGPFLAAGAVLTWCLAPFVHLNPFGSWA